MPGFSERDINEARKRVQEMQSRASRFVSDEPSIPPVANDAQNTGNQKSDEQNAPAPTSDEDTQNDKSSLVILALILILSKEGADNMLILALLYLLL